MNPIDPNAAVEQAPESLDGELSVEEIAVMDAADIVNDRRVARFIDHISDNIHILVDVGQFQIVQIGNAQVVVLHDTDCLLPCRTGVGIDHIIKVNIARR